MAAKPWPGFMSVMPWLMVWATFLALRIPPDGHGNGHGNYGTADIKRCRDEWRVTLFWVFVYQTHPSIQFDEAVWFKMNPQHL